MLAPGSVLQNRYRIIRKLAAGGMGAIYEAVDQRLNSIVALKETSMETAEMSRAFEREASLLANLHHPALPVVIDHFLDAGGQFLVMQFIAGDDLATRLEKRGNAFPVSEVLEWADQLLDALDYLHLREPPIVHRDIKPLNIKLGRGGQAILLDFGLAKGAIGQMSTVTGGGSVFGYSPRYAPLEQIHGAGTDPRSDIYSLGATLYNLITATIPADAPTRYNALEEGRDDPLRPANKVNSEVTENLSDVIRTAMAISRRDRFGNAAEMRMALRGVLDTQSEPAAVVGDVSKIVEAHPSDEEETLLHQTANHTSPAVSSAFSSGAKQDLVQRFWDGFHSQLALEKSNIQLNKPYIPPGGGGKSWRNKSMGRGFTLAAQLNASKNYVDVNITVGSRQYDLFVELHSQRELLKDKIGADIDWRLNPGGESWVIVRRDFELAKLETWEATYDWLLEHLKMFYGVFVPRIASLRAPTEGETSPDSVATDYPNATLIRLINSVGKSTFVRYYREFADSSLSNKDVVELLPNKYTLKSRNSRTSHARRIFRDGMEKQALEIIASSGADAVTTNNAMELLRSVRRGENI